MNDVKYEPELERDSPYLNSYLSLKRELWVPIVGILGKTNGTVL